MAKLVFDERFGELTFAQRAAYRKYNVSQSDHDMLTDIVRADAHEDLTQIVKDYSPNGMFDVFAAVRDLRRGREHQTWLLQRA
jgi:hypothetical protein